MRRHARLVALVGFLVAAREGAAQDLLDRIKMGVDEAQRFKQQLQTPPPTGSQPGQQGAGPQNGVPNPGQQGAAQQNAGLSIAGEQGAGQQNAGIPNPGLLGSLGLTGKLDCCTAETSARIAGTAGFIDVVGIKLGMAVRDAVQAIRAANADMKAYPVDIARLDALPQTELTASVFAPTSGFDESRRQNFRGQGGEIIGLALTLPPNAPYVWGVTRSILFTPQQMPTAENLVASLRGKYGPESFKVAGTDQMVWIFDAQGRQVPGQKAQTVFSACSGAIWHIAAYSPGPSGGRPRADLPNTKVHGQLKGGYYYSSNGRDPSEGVCASHSVIHVLYGTSTAPGQPRNLVSELKINAANHQLEYTGIEASHRMLLEASGQRDQQRAQEASARSGPKL
jgi:hypothetical protein